MKKHTNKLYAFLLLGALIFADQLTKLLAADLLKGKTDYPLIKNILEFSYLENTGAAFSSFLGRQGFLIALTSCVMLFLLWKYFNIPKGKRYTPMRGTFLLLLAGGTGNLIDRVLNGYVVDFIYFVPVDFPKFNLADCYVTIGMAVLCVLCFFHYKEEELDFLFRLKK